MLQCDVRQFFPSIDHAILRAILARKDPADRRDVAGGSILDSGVGVLAKPTIWSIFPAMTCWRRCGREACPSAT